MDLARMGSAFVQLEVDGWNAALGTWPRFDRDYYEQTEKPFQRWVSEFGAAGLVAPLGVIIRGVYMAGFLLARLPRPLRGLEVLATLVWVAGAVRASARGG